VPAILLQTTSASRHLTAMDGGNAGIVGNIFPAMAKDPCLQLSLAFMHTYSESLAIFMRLPRWATSLGLVIVVG